MSLQQNQRVDLGEIYVSKSRLAIYTIANIGTGVALTIYDTINKVGGIAHIVMPESLLASPNNEDLPGKYANLAIPYLLEKFTELGGEKRGTVVRMVGGAQLFNFGGGGGNSLNIGARNATAIRAAMSKLGFVIEKADTGGNKGKSVRFIIASGQLFVCPIGGKEYLL
jgi:chemotaxis protein CheD